MKVNGIFLEKIKEKTIPSIESMAALFIAGIWKWRMKKETTKEHEEINTICFHKK